MSNRIDILTPPGRLVRGSLYKAQDTDGDGKPLVIKKGANAGQPRVQFYLAVAIAKAGERHWGETPWGQIILATGAAAFPALYQRPDFAWKIVDGDSTMPNKRSKKPCDQEGFPGNWILNFSGGFAPKVFNADGSKQIVEADAVKPGYYIQVFGSVAGNESTQTPGIYLNHSYVAFVGYGPEIILGPDPTAVGFGGVPLPPGASVTPPPAAFNPAPPVALPPVAAPVLAPAYVPPVAAGGPLPPVVTMPVPAPNAAFLAPAVPVPPVARAMSAKANGASYEQMIANGWTDALLTQNGMFA